ncbi:MAG: IMP cyclohydrolase [Clostridia bacterium]|nr:IMP cyclohydrolase [Clostridia bacterium]
MNVYEKKTITELIKGNPYVGRGIIVGADPEGETVIAYFIMGRSENSRNSIFEVKDDGIYTRPFDESKVSDPSLIIYRALGWADGRLVVTNGDQTDTVIECLKRGESFEAALRTREFEPDAPNFTPRISAVVSVPGGDYKMSILKSADPEGKTCARYFFEYPGIPGLGHFIHTYVTDGNPLPSFCGEPERVAVPSDTKAFADGIWDALDPDNRISLFVWKTDGKGNTAVYLNNKHDRR